MAGEWSDWIDHDGSGCPLPLGTMCERKFNDWCEPRVPPVGGPTRYHMAPIIKAEMGNWSGDPRRPIQVIRYRYLRPQALVELIRLAEAPQPVRESEAA